MASHRSATIEAVPGVEPMVRDVGLDRPGLWEAFAEGELVGRSNRGIVRRFVWPRGGQTYYFKLYRLPKMWQRFRSAFRADPARREARNLSWLGAHGIPAVVPVAWGCRRTFGIVTGCFLVTRGEPGFENLETVLERAAAPLPMVRPLAAIVRRMHDGGFFAHDLHLRNILIERPGGPAVAPPRFLLLDFPNARILRDDDPRRQTAAVYDLATLDRDAAAHLSRTQRLRFLRDYSGNARADPDLVAAIEMRRLGLLAKSDRKLRRKRRRSAP